MPGHPYTVSCRTCQEGVAFTLTHEEALRAAADHPRDHRTGVIEEGL